MKHYLLSIHKIMLALAMLSMLVGCSDTSDNIRGVDGMEIGETVQFTTMVPDVRSTTRTYEEWKTMVESYKPVQLDYTFTIEMWKQGATQASALNTYRPKQSTNVGADKIPNYDGTLESTSDVELYWQDNVNNWGFKAEANNNSLLADQSTQEKWLRMDYLKGHSYLPLWNSETGIGTNPEEIQYKTNKQWYADNRTAKDLSGLMPEEGEGDNMYKKVPLYMKHQRAWITVILKAGEGVQREALQYNTSEENIHMTINSYAEGIQGAFPIDKAWSREVLIHYDKDKNGPAANNVSTTRYDAIVMPHNYATKKEEEVIAKINLSGQNFSFYAGNDNRYLSAATEEQKAEADQAYNLQAGKHLTLEVTLSRESRKILITAWIEDWTEVATATICDDYGQNGDPVVIKDKDELIAFLTGNNNKPGSVGIIQPTELDLDAVSDWTGNYDLDATLNLAGCVLKTKHQLFKNLSSSANLVNGTVLVGNGATVDCAIADKNEGTIERINVLVPSETSTAKATVAGMVKENHGTIYQCRSDLTVSGTSGLTYNGTKFVGGIAALSTSPDGSMSVIDGCTVNASVNGVNDVYGGGIVGYTTGRVTNNTFEYGITVSQDIQFFKNIFARAGSEAVRAYGNKWPTTALNKIGNSEGTNLNTYEGTKYDAVLDSQVELDRIMITSSLNNTGKNYRISKSFTVGSDWDHGIKQDDYGANVNNVSFNLDGNGKTITLTGDKQVKTTDGSGLQTGTVSTYTTTTMLFNHVLGEIKDLILYLDKPLVAEPSVNDDPVKTYKGDDAIAPLAYAVYGVTGKLTNIKVKGADGTYVQSCTPAGLVVWAYGGASVTGCKVNIPVHMWLPESMGNDAKHYAGGIVACAGIATIKQCQYLGNSETSVSGAVTSTSAKKSQNYFYGGIVGGTSEKGSETPKLQITDCSSWFIAKRQSDSDPDKSSRGAIIAYTQYRSTATSLPSGMNPDKVSEGNWWQINAIGAHSWASGMTEETVIGKKNSVTPTYDINF